MIASSFVQGNWDTPIPLKVSSMAVGRTAYDVHIYSREDKQLLSCQFLLKKIAKSCVPYFPDADRHRNRSITVVFSIRVIGEKVALIPLANSLEKNPG